MAEVMIPRRSHEIMEALTAEDFETASIRSAAPSYCARAALIWAQCVVIGVFRSSAGQTRARKQRAPRMAFGLLAGTPAACPLACLPLMSMLPSTSEAPTLHYTVPNSGYSSLLPPYTAPPVGSAERVVAPPRHRPGAASNAAAAARRAGSAASGTGAGTVFSMPDRVGNVRRDDNIPDLSRFRVPSWSTISTSPNARLYHSVALRRVAAAEHAEAAAEIGGLMRRLAVLERMEQEEAAASRRMAAAAARRNASAGGGNGNASGNGVGASGGSAVSNNRSGNGGGNNAIGRLSTGNGSFRPLEDPYLVGETAARRARAERMARESNAHGEEALHREDRRWDWFLGQIKNRHGSGRLRRRMDASGLAPASLRHHHARRVQ